MNRVVIEKVPIKKILDGWLPLFGLTNFHSIAREDPHVVQGIGALKRGLSEEIIWIMLHFLEDKYIEI